MTDQISNEQKLDLFWESEEKNDVAELIELLEKLEESSKEIREMLEEKEYRELFRAYKFHHLSRTAKRINEKVYGLKRKLTELLI